MKRIGIDCRFANFQAGLGRYTRELVTHLLKRDDLIEYTLFVASEKDEWLKGMTAKNYTLKTISSTHYSLSEQIILPKKIAASKIDLYFSPHFNVPLRCPVPFVVTIHDLILHDYPNQATFFKRCAYKYVMHHSLSRARDVIAVSKFVSRELERVYQKGNVTVILEGVHDSFTKRSDEEQVAVRKKHGLQKPFFLYVGNAKEHKNVQMLIDAFSDLQDADTELVLVVGGPEAAKLCLSNGVRLIKNVSNADLPALYSAARTFVTASLYEGFGLPIIEAQACECPVIAVNASAIPEVAGSNALLVEPTVTALREAMASPPNASSLLKEFSWVLAAEKTAQVLVTCAARHDCSVGLQTDVPS